MKYEMGSVALSIAKELNISYAEAITYIYDNEKLLDEWHGAGLTHEQARKGLIDLYVSQNPKNGK